jgi:protoheme ferro-lyase
VATTAARRHPAAAVQAIREALPAIWTPAGSPLLVESEKQRARLQAALGDGYRVVLGMAYAGPSFDRAIDDLLAAGISTAVVLPMFPQYSSATTASVYDAVFAAATDRAGRARVLVPSLSCVPPYFDHPGYIDALCARIRAAIAVEYSGSRRVDVPRLARALRHERRSLSPALRSNRGCACSRHGLEPG